MLNQMILLKQPIAIGRPSCFLTSFHLPPPPLRSSTSSVVISPPIVHMRSTKSCGLSLLHPLLRVASPKPINCINKTTPADKKDSDSSDEDDEPITKCKCKAREDNGVLYLTCDIAGLEKEDVIKIIPEKNGLVVKAKKRQETRDDDDSKDWKYCVTFTFDSGIFKINEIKTEMKNGLLKVALPRERWPITHIMVNIGWSFLLLGGLVLCYLPLELVTAFIVNIGWFFLFLVGLVLSYLPPSKLISVLFYVYLLTKGVRAVLYSCLVFPVLLWKHKIPLELEMSSNKQDVYRLKFEGRSIYDELMKL